MRTNNTVQCALIAVVGTLCASMTTSANVDVVLDGYDYTSSNNIVYRSDYKKIKYTSISDCSRKSGLPIPTPGSGAKLRIANGVHIGLSSVSYNLSQERFYLSSEAGDLVCGGGLYTDQLFAGHFDSGQ